jgi:hypothetical protein
MLAAAREADPGGEYVLADAASLPFPDGHADLAVAFMSLMGHPRSQDEGHSHRRVLRRFPSALLRVDRAPARRPIGSRCAEPVAPVPIRAGTPPVGEVPGLRPCRG